MKLRLLVTAAAWLATAILLGRGGPATDACAHAETGAGCQTPGPTALPSATGGGDASPTSVASTPVPTIAPSVTPPEYSFRDEFGGTRLHRVWGTHWDPFGATVWSGRQLELRDGVLRITARREGDHWVSALLDTAETFEQRYGTFSARIRFGESAGVWPAFWLAQPPNRAGGEAEIDAMEVCASPPGTNGGGDVTELLLYVHRVDGSHAFEARVRTGDLSDAWHVYTVDWRPKLVTFYLDGVEVARLADATEIPGMPMAIVLDLAGEAAFCRAGDIPTPDEVTMEVDWVRVTR